MTSIFTDEPKVDFSPDDFTLTEAGILVVDEDPAFQLGLKTFLKEYVGFEKVFTARNGKEAIEMIEREKSIELLTVDFQMPVMDGMEMLKRLQQSAPRPLGVTMITGFPSDELKRDFANLTSSKLLTTHFLAKPVEFEKLEPVILASFEELKRSQRLTQTLTGGDEAGDFPFGDLNSMAMDASNRELMAKFDVLEEKLDQNTRAILYLSRTRFFASFFGDIFKLLIAGLIGYIAWQSGWLTNIGEKLNPAAVAAEIETLEPSAAAVPIEPEKTEKAAPLPPVGELIPGAPVNEVNPALERVIPKEPLPEANFEKDNIPDREPDTVE